MRRLRIIWWGLPLIALVALAGWFVIRHVKDGGVLLPPEARAPARAPGEVARLPHDLPSFRATREGERILLSGLLAPGEVRNAVLDQLKQAVPNAVVAEELKGSAEVPPGLGEAAGFAVRQLARLPVGTVAVGDGAIVIAGQAPDVETYNAIVGAGAKPPANYRVDVSALVPPPVRPYTWSASMNENEITLAGHVPSEAARRDVRTAAARVFPDKRLVERLQPASGLPPGVDFTATVHFALTQLAQLRAGAAELVDMTLSFRGDVTDKSTLTSLRATALPTGVQAGAIAIAVRPPSPYAFHAKREAGVLILTGYYPDQASHAAIHELIRNRFFSEQIVDKLRAADGAPKRYLAGVSFGLEHLSRLASGEVIVRDTSVEVRGEALYEETAEQTARAVRAVSLPGWTGKAEVRLRSSEKASVEP
jgi:hypothetical protein